MCQQCRRTYHSPRPGRFCSTTCRNEYNSRVIKCDHCHAFKRVARGKAQNGRRHFCDATCQASYWREHRTQAAKGACVDCGGSTSKRSYHRCRPCAIEAMHGRSVSDSAHVAAETYRIGATDPDNPRIELTITEETEEPS